MVSVDENGAVITMLVRDIGVRQSHSGPGVLG